MADVIALVPTKQDTTPPGMPPLEAQREELRTRFMAYSTGLRLQDGDLVRFKPGLGPFHQQARENTAVIFWRYLVPGVRGDELHVNRCTDILGYNPKLDCLVAYFVDAKLGLMVLAADSSTLEVCPPEAPIAVDLPAAAPSGEG